MANGREGAATLRSAQNGPPALLTDVGPFDLVCARVARGRRFNLPRFEIKCVVVKGGTTVISVREKKLFRERNIFWGVVPPTSGIVGVHKIVKTFLLQLQ